jgi:cephalosporin hydroxylase
MSDFQDETRQRLKSVRADAKLLAHARAFTESSVAAKYSYNFLWLGRPIIQYPQDMVAMQELVWATRPDLIIETGIAHGGSLVLSASLLTLLDYADAAASGELLDPRAPRRRVLGIDIDIREHNRKAILAHPLAGRIDMLQGSSTAPDIIAQVAEVARGFERVMVCLDSNHTHEHVLAELRAYAPLVSPGCYCVVFDTVIEDLPAGVYPDRPWDIGNNPRTAVKAYLATHPEFVVDEDIEARLLVTVAPGGYLRRLDPA